jgi:hypothetical protein
VGLLSREQIVNNRQAFSATVEVPEWGGSVQIRPLSAGDVQSMAGLLTTGGGDLASNLDMAFAIVVYGTTNETGGPLFAGPEDLRSLEVGPIIRLASAIAEVSGIGGGAAAGK